jgi:mRNA-degrading endonuclease toxin of MazEF toxin-antitoxin module
MKRGEIYYIKQNAPVNEEEPGKPSGRPAIIVSNDAYIERTNRVQVVYLTTRDTEDLPTNVDIRSMARPSVALCGQICWVFKDIIDSFVCAITPHEMMMVDTALAISLGLTFDKPEKKEKPTPIKERAQDPAAMFVPDPATVAALGAFAEVRPSDMLLRMTIERDTYKNLYADLLDRFFKM